VVWHVVKNMNSNGKIGRLSKEVRDELGGRLENGETGVQLVEWLNGLPAVQEVLKSQFEGRPITEQNLSEWKQRGFREWQRHQEVREHLRSLSERAGELEGEAGAAAISDRMASWLGAELAVHAQKLLEATEDPKERWRCLREVLRELRHLRRQDHERQRMRIQQERWELERERGKAELLKLQREEASKQATKAALSGCLDELFGRVPGSGTLKTQATRALTSLQPHLRAEEREDEDEAAGDAGTPTRAEEGRERDQSDQSDQRDGGRQARDPNPGESDQIRPNPSESDHAGEKG
jgi:hypothetical protein